MNMRYCYMSYRSIARLNLSNVENIIGHWSKYIPYIKPYYAVKSFQNDDLLKFLSKNNFGFDCASMNEIKLVKDYNAPIIFANPTKSIDDINYAINNNVDMIVVDSIEEIIKIMNINRNVKFIIRILGDETFSSIRFNNKFGATYEEFINMLNFINDNNLILSGFSYHNGSKCHNMKSHYNSVRNIIENYIEPCYSFNLKPTLIDIGGGFENVRQLQDINEVLEPLKNTISNINVKLIAEPGRLISSVSLDIYTKIIALRERNVDGIKTLYITINDSVYHSFQGKIYDGQNYEPIPLYDNNELIRCIIFGQTCDSLDMITENVILPYPKLNDILLFKNMGAYTIASAYGEFNGFKPAIVLHP